MGKIFSVPYNQDPKIIFEYIKRKKYIIDVYLPSNPSVYSTGRDSFINQSGMPQRTKTLMALGMEQYDLEIKDIIKILKANDIYVSMVMNASCDGGKYCSDNEFEKLIKYIETFDDLGALVISNPVHALRFKKAMPWIKVKSSVIAGIDTVRKAIHWEEYSKIDTIALASDINKKTGLIKAIRENVNAKLQMIVNSGCMHGCPFFMHHYNYLSHISENINRKYFSYESECKKIIDKSPWLLFTCQYIVPGNIRYYENLIDEYKIVDRLLPTEKIIAYLDMYIEGNSRVVLPFDSEWGYVEPEDVFTKVSKCNRVCKTCGWCKKKWELNLSPTNTAHSKY